MLETTEDEDSGDTSNIYIYIGDAFHRAILKWLNDIAGYRLEHDGRSNEPSEQVLIAKYNEGIDTGALKKFLNGRALSEAVFNYFKGDFTTFLQGVCAAGKLGASEEDVSNMIANSIITIGQHPTGIIIQALKQFNGAQMLQLSGISNSNPEPLKLLHRYVVEKVKTTLIQHAASLHNFLKNCANEGYLQTLFDGYLADYASHSKKEGAKAEGGSGSKEGKGQDKDDEDDDDEEMVPVPELSQSMIVHDAKPPSPTIGDALKYPLLNHIIDEVIKDNKKPHIRLTSKIICNHFRNFSAQGDGVWIQSFSGSASVATVRKIVYPLYFLVV